MRNLLETEGASAKAGFSEVQERLEKIGENLSRRGHQISDQILSQIRENPWPYLAGIAAASWAAGYFMGQSRRAH